MTATGHAIIGTVIAAKITNPALAIPIAILSHIAADSFPHWDTATNKDTKGKKLVLIHSAIDVALGFILSFLIIYFIFPQTNYGYAFVMIISAQLFDWLTAPYYFFKIKQFKIFYKFQLLFDNKLDKPWGIIGQVTVLVLLVLIAKII